MALTEVTQGTGYWQPFRPDYIAAELSEITDVIETLTGKFIQLPDRSIYYSDGVTASLAFDEFLRPQFISSGQAGSQPIQTVSETYLATVNDYTVLADAVSAGFTITLPTAGSAVGKIFNFKKIDDSANVVTIDGDGTETIDGSETYPIGTVNQSVTIQSNGTAWYIISEQ